MLGLGVVVGQMRQHQQGSASGVEAPPAAAALATTPSDDIAERDEGPVRSSASRAPAASSRAGLGCPLTG
jgi:hypothetical protein